MPIEQLVRERPLQLQYRLSRTDVQRHVVRQRAVQRAGLVVHAMPTDVLGSAVRRRRVRRLVRELPLGAIVHFERHLLWRIDVHVRRARMRTEQLRRRLLRDVQRRVQQRRMLPGHMQAQLLRSQLR